MPTEVYEGQIADKLRLIDLSKTMFTLNEEEREEVAEILFRLKRAKRQHRPVTKLNNVR